MLLEFCFVVFFNCFLLEKCGFVEHCKSVVYSSQVWLLFHTSVERAGHLCGVNGTQVWNKSRTSVE